MGNGIKVLKNMAKVVAGTVAGTAGTEIDAYAYLREVWNDNLQPTHVRLRAAQIGIEVERKRLAVSAVIDNRSDLASLLDERIKRFEGMKLIEEKPTAEVTNIVTKVDGGNGATESNSVDGGN